MRRRNFDRAAKTARLLLAAKSVCAAETARYDIGLRTHRQIEAVGDTIVTDRDAFEALDQRLDLTGDGHAPGHGSATSLCGRFKLGDPLRTDRVHGAAEFFDALAKPAQFLFADPIMF